MSSKLLRRGLVIVAMLPMLWIGASGAHYMLNDRRASRLSAAPALARFPEPDPSSRIMVIAPHPDDETLGCGGLLQRCATAGGAACVVFLTDGDGFRVGVERQFRTIRATPDDYRRFATLRREEALRACSLLGVGRRSVTFMGFPDRGLDRLLTVNWSDGTPFASPETRLAACSAGSAEPGTPYSGVSVVRTLSDQMQQFRPTMVLTTHPADDHRDHSAAAAFTALALKRLRDSGVEWAHQATLYSYLVHRGDWPQPQGMNSHSRLSPPTEMLGLEGDWLNMPLTRGQVARKSDALNQYSTQLAVMRRFLSSFVRSNEVFVHDPGAHIPSLAVAPGLGTDILRSARPIVLDPVGDDVVRAMQPEADIRSVSAVVSSGSLYVAVSTAKRPSAKVRTRVMVRCVDGTADQTGRFLAADARGVRVGRTAPATSWDAGSGVGFVFPVGTTSRDACYIVEAQTRIGIVSVDRTGPRVIRATPPSTD